MADFSISKILNKIAKYDKLTTDIPNIDTLVEYKLINNYLSEKVFEPKEYSNSNNENIIEDCTEIKTYLNKVLKPEKK